MKVKILLVLFMVGSFAQGAFAGGPTNKAIVERLVVHQSNTFVRAFSGQINGNPDNCDRTDFYVLDIVKDDANSELMIKLLMGAHLSKKQMVFTVNGCRHFDNWGDLSRPVIKGIQVY